jgi:hypothetical protein
MYPVFRISNPQNSLCFAHHRLVDHVVFLLVPHPFPKEVGHVFVHGTMCRHMKKYTLIPKIRRLDKQEFFSSKWHAEAKNNPCDGSII